MQICSRSLKIWSVEGNWFTSVHQALIFAVFSVSSNNRGNAVIDLRPANTPTTQTVNQVKTQKYTRFHLEVNLKYEGHQSSLQNYRKISRMSVNWGGCLSQVWVWLLAVLIFQKMDEPTTMKKTVIKMTYFMTVLIMNLHVHQCFISARAQHTPTQLKANMRRSDHTNWNQTTGCSNIRRCVWLCPLMKRAGTCLLQQTLTFI